MTAFLELICLGLTGVNHRNQQILCRGRELSQLNANHRFTVLFQRRCAAQHCSQDDNRCRSQQGFTFLVRAVCYDATLNRRVEVANTVSPLAAFSWLPMQRLQPGRSKYRMGSYSVRALCLGALSSNSKPAYFCRISQSPSAFNSSMML